MKRLRPLPRALLAAALPVAVGIALLVRAARHRVHLRRAREVLAEFEPRTDARWP
ncbi:hypothetical protein [Kitasatospora sp. DSM 101779]|uniref:hypothetical protein n=1 Tax=Kitasatospora sp. DSM 101779 TaxID=2853165 RepID=UPI0021DA218B|nr:hypothetical protein [Kitasatospora sp. DSM 101779]MCU7821187.1 hypothetical protein [Kitasatospora sp. DSM 101779]